MTGRGRRRLVVEARRLPPHVLRAIILRSYPQCPDEAVAEMVRHWCSRKWRSRDQRYIADAIVLSHIRHSCTPYEHLMRDQGWARDAARAKVQPQVAAVRQVWRGLSDSG